jgi:hypothetical protein
LAGLEAPWPARPPALPLSSAALALGGSSPSGRWLLGSCDAIAGLGPRQLRPRQCAAPSLTLPLRTTWMAAVAGLCTLCVPRLVTRWTGAFRPASVLPRTLWARAASRAGGEEGAHRGCWENVLSATLILPPAEKLAPLHRAVHTDERPLAGGTLAAPQLRLKLSRSMHIEPTNHDSAGG